MIMQMSGHERPPIKLSRVIASLTAACSLSSLTPISWPFTTEAAGKYSTDKTCYTRTM
jgi:hypothetical protein